MPVPKPWPVIESLTEGDYRVFTLRRDRTVSPRTGRNHDFFVLESPDWINVIPVTTDGDVVMVRQYRHGIREVTLEIPGGLVDAGDSDLQTSACRELLEETGYAPATILPIGSVHAQPALQNNRCHTFLALGCTRVADPTPDAGEDLRVETFPVGEVPGKIAGGEITHGLVLAAFYWYEQWLNREKS